MRSVKMQPIVLLMRRPPQNLAPRAGAARPDFAMRVVKLLLSAKSDQQIALVTVQTAWNWLEGHPHLMLERVASIVMRDAFGRRCGVWRSSVTWMTKMRLH